MAMTPYNEIFELYSSGYDYSQIERMTGAPRRSITEAIRLAKLYDLTLPVEPPMTNAQIHSKLHPKDDESINYPNEEMVLLEKFITYKPVPELWKEYVSRCKDKGEKFCSMKKYKEIIHDAESKYPLPKYSDDVTFQYVRDAFKGNDGHEYGLLIGQHECSRYTAIVPVADEQIETFVKATNKAVHALGGLTNDCMLCGIPNTVHKVMEDCLIFHNTWGLLSGYRN